MFKSSPELKQQTPVEPLHHVCPHCVWALKIRLSQAATPHGWKHFFDTGVANLNSEPLTMILDTKSAERTCKLPLVFFPNPSPHELQTSVTSTKHFVCEFYRAASVCKAVTSKVDSAQRCWVMDSHYTQLERPQSRFNWEEFLTISTLAEAILIAF